MCMLRRGGVDIAAQENGFDGSGAPQTVNAAPTFLTHDEIWAEGAGLESEKVHVLTPS